MTTPLQMPPRTSARGAAGLGRLHLAHIDPHSRQPRPPYSLTARGGSAASAASDWRDFVSGLLDIFLHTWHRV